MLTPNEGDGHMAGSSATDHCRVLHNTSCEQSIMPMGTYASWPRPADRLQLSKLVLISAIATKEASNTFGVTLVPQTSLKWCLFALNWPSACTSANNQGDDKIRKDNCEHSPDPKDGCRSVEINLKCSRAQANA